ncbi:glycosyltransferase family 2 protein [Leptolyngbya sp. FACHB-541]|uniref:glycosyltransferase family 2 protein n=1 Tax=Leptolyngbya sp. FACHB-541 TaxID=2692810 RepID=UPI00168508B8|nr:glycosyltransferase family 2 protein [Leptolyngbya sp. FACHB-541]MBD2001065.1 glycosyltransferase family 2 protein [Leptolyngbya sp. FACHB-541]
MTTLLPVSALVPTRNRAEPFARTLNSLAQQSAQPMEMIVVDGSQDDKTEQLCQQSVSGLETEIRYYRATALGAATQRNQAFAHVSQEFIWLMDDDILLEPECLTRLWNALQSDPLMGGVNAMITNQRYLPPGRISRTLFQYLHGQAESTYAGKCIGPALNLLPEDDPDLPEIVPVEWLNTTCTLYRRVALPNPLFPSNFVGYSLMEDVTLSLTVGKQWKLANARTARIFHDSQPGDHKNSHYVLAKMELLNRYFVMTQVLERQTLKDHLKLAVLQLFELVALLQTFKGWRSLPSVLIGKAEGLLQLWQSGQLKTVAESVK